MEDKEALEPSAVIGNTADLVEDLIDQLFANSVVATRVVVGCILLASDHLLWVEEGSVGAGADFVDDVGLEIAVDGTWDIFAIAYVDIVSVSGHCRFGHVGNSPVSEKKVLKP